MDLAITGASGFLGRCLIGALQTTGHRLTLLGRSLSGLRKALADTGLHLVETDYSLEHLRSDLGRCDVLIHLAARRFERHLTSIVDYFENMRITENLLNACLSLGCRRFILASTCAVYTNKTNRLPFREQDAVRPLHPYAVSKVVGEYLGFRHCPGFIGLRFGQLVGLGERRGFMLMTFIENALRHEPLTVFGNGSGTRDYLYVRDAAAAIVRAVERPEATGLFNIGSGIETSHRDLASMIQAAFSDGQSALVFDRQKSEDTSRIRLDITKAQQDLGWAPRYTLSQAFQEMRAEIRAGVTSPDALRKL